MTDNTEHRWTVDSIDEGVARIEENGERMISIPVHLLPAGTKEGQVLRVSRAVTGLAGTVGLTIGLDAAGTAAALAQSLATTAAAMAESKKRDTGGNVTL